MTCTLQSVSRPYDFIIILNKHKDKHVFHINYNFMGKIINNVDNLLEIKENGYKLYFLNQNIKLTLNNNNLLHYEYLDFPKYIFNAQLNDDFIPNGKFEIIKASHSILKIESASIK